MAYFSNGNEGMLFDEQCAKCRYGQEPCPINLAQTLYNYDAVNNDTASQILMEFVKNDGTCIMYEMFSKDFKLTEGEKTQLDLFTQGG